jgi:hypothetical protein
VGAKRVDFIIDEVVVEIKAKAELEAVDFANAVLSESVRLQGGFTAQLWSAEAGDQAAGELKKMESLEEWGR